jgi:hypothetical protein
MSLESEMIQMMALIKAQNIGKVYQTENVLDSKK